MFYRETKFKGTDSDKVPVDWEVRPAEDLFYIKGRIGWRGLKRAHFTTEGPYLITGIDFADGRITWEDCVHIPMDKFLESPEIFVHKDDILMTKDGTIGKVAYVYEVPDGKASINAHLFLIRNLEGAPIHPMYTYYALRANYFLRYARLWQVGTTRAGFSQRAFEQFPFLLPSLDEQQEIVEVLSCVDLAIQKTDEVIAKTERLKKGLMQKLLTEGIGHKEFIDTEIGKTPREWEVVIIGDVCTQRNEMFQPSGRDYSRFVGLEHIVSGETRISDCAKDVAVKSSKFKFYAGDILYGKLRPYLDKAAMAEFDGICSTDLIVLEHKDTILKELLTYVLHSERFLGHAIATTSGTNHPRTSWSAISKFRLGLPKPSEQQKISEIMTAIDRKLQFEKMEKTKLDRIKLGFMDLLLTGKVRVGVD